jgi:hypothetical protein
MDLCESFATRPLPAGCPNNYSTANLSVMRNGTIRNMMKNHQHSIGVTGVVTLSSGDCTILVAVDQAWRR